MKTKITLLCLSIGLFGCQQQTAVTQSNQAVTKANKEMSSKSDMKAPEGSGGKSMKVTEVKALKLHQFRLNNLPKLYDQEVIPRSSAPRTIPKTIAANKTIEGQMAKSELLSVMHYDGKAITVDLLSSDLSESDKMYSFSLSKSFLSFVLGNAACDGTIDLNAKVVSYVPETRGTLYENVTISQMLDMAAGDAAIYGNKRDSQEYNPLLMKVKAEDRKTVQQVLAEKATGVSSNTVGKFRYSDAVTDLLGRALDNASNGGLSNLYKTKLSEPAGNAEDSFYLKDSNGWPLLHAYFHATRDDYFRMALHIAETWKSDSCVGNYLREGYTNRLQASGDTEKSYGRQFWFDSKIGSPDLAVMSGFGGQKIYIDMKTGAVTTLHAIRPNYDLKQIVNEFH